jgi:hypothetical protein
MERSPGDFFEQFLRISWGYCDIPDFEKRRLENNEAMTIQFFRENSRKSHGFHQWSLDRLLHPRNVGWWLSPIDSPKIME